MTSGLERYKDLSKLTQSSVQTQDSVPLALYFSHACRSCWKKGLRCSCGYGVWVYFLQGESRSLSPILGLLSWKPSHSPSSLSLVTAKIDKVARIDYSLVASPIATADSLDLPLKVRITLLPQTQGSSLASKTNLQGLGPLSASPCSSLPTSSILAFLPFLTFPVSVLARASHVPSAQGPPPAALHCSLPVSAQIGARQRHLSGPQTTHGLLSDAPE